VKKYAWLLFAILLCGTCSASARQEAFEQNAFQPKGTENFRFVVMGDNRPHGGAKDIVTQNGYFLGNIGRANAADADFVVLAGDLILGRAGKANLISQKWDAYDKACKLFDMPYVSVAGNHDIWDKRSQRIWQERYGPLWFSWDHKGCHFIALNSEVVGQTNKITGLQLKWLKDDLENAASARRIFVFLHKPLWAGKQNQWNTVVHPLLAKYGVDTVFGAHCHQYTLCPTKDGVRYVITGGAGAELSGQELAGGFYHFLNVDVTGNTSDYKIITASGELPADCVTTQGVKKLKNAIKVEPLTKLPKTGPITIRVSVPNPTNRPVRALLVSNAGGSSWNIQTGQTIIPPKSRKTIIAKVAYKNAFPLPRSITVKLVDMNITRTLFSWQILNKLTSNISPPTKQ